MAYAMPNSVRLASRQLTLPTWWPLLGIAKT
uniref:Uncharacterized protein n=1 Tax=Setaria italica TaxID=4555 RepID=K3Y3T6_SETIT